MRPSFLCCASLGMAELSSFLHGTGSEIDNCSCVVTICCMNSFHPLRASASSFFEIFFRASKIFLPDGYEIFRKLYFPKTIELCRSLWTTLYLLTRSAVPVLTTSHH